MTLAAAPPAIRRVHIPRLPLEHGGELRDLHVAFEAHGDDALPAVLVLGGISAGRQLMGSGAGSQRGWWNGVAGPGLALDPERHRIVTADWLGGSGESTQPRRVDEWPAFTTGDQAAALVAVLDELGIDSLWAVVGASYGGMVALALAAQFPDRVDRVITIGAAHRSHPLATAVRSVQRRIVRLGTAAGRELEAIATARALAMTTYRTPVEFRERFDAEPVIDGARAMFAIDAYLDHHGSGFAASFAAAGFLVICQALDLHRVEPADIRARCTLVGIDSDTLVPPGDVRDLAAAIGPHAAFTLLRSRFGHDAFLKEAAAVGDIIGRALADSPVHDDAVAPPAPGPDGLPLTSFAARADTRTRTRSRVTSAVRAGIGADTQHGAVIPPIHLSSTFSFAGYDRKRPYDYTRSGNPTRDVLAAAIAQLEGGAAGIITATGMAAITVALQLLDPGDLVIAPHDGYGGTWRLLRALERRNAFALELLDLAQRDSLDIIRRRRPRMVWVETPSNPLLRITDIAAVADAAHDTGGLCVVDNTFLSPALQSPIELGADIVIHSTTKYLNGHSDMVGGALVARDTAIAEQLGWWANCIGATGAPFDSYLTLRGIRTLHARIEQHERNAGAIARYLDTHPAVRIVHYPGLPGHPGHELARRQQRGFGAMLSFELHDGDRIPAFLAALHCFTLAESLGGVESLIAHPATMTHAAMAPDARRAAGISDALLRLSVGIESDGDLIADLEQAFARSETR